MFFGVELGGWTLLPVPDPPTSPRSLLNAPPPLPPFQIGLVSQEPLLFATSILDNIKYGAPDATLQQVGGGQQGGDR